MTSAHGAPHNGWDAARFEALYDAWSDRLYRYAVHLAGPGASAEDLFQETWMKAIERGGQLRDERLFGPWLLRIARNLAFNQSRQGRRRGQVWIFANLFRDDGQAEQALMDRHPDGAPDPRQCAMDTERQQVLKAVLTALEPMDQEMLQLRYFEGLTLAEVAAVMELPSGTVCTRIYRALKTIRTGMKRQGYSSLGAI